ncbi:hypothetical protein HPB49_022483 [Dermacentor silvarum]|uniref:Uncharacterized protein n=1 Tax=Dermacentor silvarum TaxID=543639 RepID=A0ACB8D8C8_DERSI|nr:uncharacterized protein LOC119445584 [Dermacentor silvarum]KAH7960709.1 hypothetical protein HPB49_022483 [Dermacentor silvarum]
MADQATGTACVDVQQRDGGAVSPKHVLAKPGGSPFFQEGHMNAGEQKQHSEELAKMMAKMMSCSPMDMGPDGGHLTPDDFAASQKMRDLLAKAEHRGEEDDYAAVQRIEDLVAQGRGLLEQMNDTLNTLLAAELNSTASAAEDADASR